MPPIDEKPPVAPVAAAEPAPEAPTPEATEQEANAALTAGYNKVKPPEAKAEPVAAVEPAPAEPAKPDPWEGVPPVVRSALETITGKLGAIDSLAKEVKVGTGRISAIQSQMDIARAAAKTTESAPTPAQIESASKDKEKWDALKSDFPEWTEAMDARLAAQRDEILKAIPKPERVDVEALRRDVGASVSAETIKFARAFARVDAKHDNWESDVRAPEFAAWMKTQAPDVQALAASSDATDAIKMLDMYYDHRKTADRKDKNRARLDSAVTPKQATSGGPSILPDEAGLSVGYKRVKRA